MQACHFLHLMSAPFDPAAIALVRRTQKAIARDFLLRELAKFPARDAFQSVATSVTHHYFPRALARENTDNIEDLIELYAHAFVLAPLTYRLTGAYRPDWNTGTILSWFRRCITTNTNQMKWSVFPVEISYDPESIFSALEVAGKLRDQTFMKTVGEIFANLTLSGGRKSSVARLFIDPFLGHAVDADVQARFNVRSHGATRTKLRARKAPVGSYLRLGSTGILLADSDSAKAADWPHAWHDIRDKSIQFGDYIIQWLEKEKHLRIRLDDAAIRASLSEIKRTMSAAPTTYLKYRGALRISGRFLEQHRFATGSLRALQEYEREVARMVRRHVTATAKNLEVPAGRVQLYEKLVLPITNPFRETNREKLSDNTWISFWNPYREWKWK